MIIRYQQKDLIPFAMTVLVLYHDTYIVNAFKFMIHEDFPDLLGLVGTDCMDSSGYELMHDHRDTPYLRIIYTSLEEILTTCYSVCNLYGLDLEDVCNREPYGDATCDFFNKIVIDCFPADHSTDEIADVQYRDFLPLYALSAVPLIGSLCALIANEEVDLHEIWGGHLWWLPYLGTDFSKHENYIALGLLQQLGAQLSEHHEEIFRA